MPRRPEQLILPDDPSFLPDFALPPPDLLADLSLDLNFGFDLSRSGDSQTLTPFGSRHSQSSHVGVIGGLVLPSSSPDAPAQFRLEGDDEPGSFGGPNDLFGAGVMQDLDEPDFTFGDNGDIIHLTDEHAIPRTPGVTGGAAMQNHAGASARVRREHEEGRWEGAKVSSVAFSHLFLHWRLMSLSLRHYSLATLRFQSCGSIALLGLS